MLGCHKAIFEQKSAEALYCRVPQNRWKDLAVDNMSAKSLVADCRLSNFRTSDFSSIDLEAWHKSQKAFFDKLDAGSAELHTPEALANKTESDEDVLTDDDMLPDRERPKKPCVHLSPAASAWKDALERGDASIATDLASLEDHTTSILTAACRALDTGLFTIPGSDGKRNLDNV